MSVDFLDHITINTKHLDDCIKFYADILGFTNGPRPNVGFPGAWMYCGDRSVIHIVVLDDPLHGPTGPIDHVAFKCTGIDDFKARIKGAGLDYGTNVIADFGLTQLFVTDPDGVKIELNFTES